MARPLTTAAYLAISQPEPLYSISIRLGTSCDWQIRWLGSSPRIGDRRGYVLSRVCRTMVT